MSNLKIVLNMFLFVFLGLSPIWATLSFVLMAISLLLHNAEDPWVGSVQIISLVLFLIFTYIGQLVYGGISQTTTPPPTNYFQK